MKVPVLVTLRLERLSQLVAKSCNILSFNAADKTLTVWLMYVAALSSNSYMIISHTLLDSPTVDGKAVPCHLLDDFCQSQGIELPRCFCGEETSVDLIDIDRGGKWVLACEQYGIRCSYAGEGFLLRWRGSPDNDSLLPS